MVNLKLLVLAALVALAAWWLLSPSEERRVRRVFNRASELIAKDSGEPIFVAAAKARGLAELVAPNAQLDIPERDLSLSLGGGDVARQIAFARSQPQFIRVSFEDISVAFSDDDTALVTADVLFKGTSELYGFSGRDTRELEATMRRGASGDWLFASIRLKPVIEK